MPVPTPCTASECDQWVKRNVCGTGRCGGILFGTTDDPGHGCGRFFCGRHLVGHHGPFYCKACWDNRKVTLGIKK